MSGAPANGAPAAPAPAAPAARAGVTSERIAAGGGDGAARPIQGTVLKIAVEAGAVVEEGMLIAVIEAMKMENEITAHKSGTIASLPIAVGASIARGDVIAVIESA